MTTFDPPNASGTIGDAPIFRTLWAEQHPPIAMSDDDLETLDTTIELDHLRTAEMVELAARADPLVPLRAARPDEMPAVWASIIMLIVFTGIITTIVVWGVIG